LITLVILSFPAFAHAALININTADKVTLMSLEGIGDTLASRIIAYRKANGPFKAIEELVPNIERLYQSEFDKIKSYITVGDTSVSDVSNATSNETASSTVSDSSKDDTTTYTPPPAALSIIVSGNEDAFLEVPLSLAARVTAKSGAPDASAQVVWSFGDGSSTTGNTVEKTYHYTGTYLVVATASDGSATARDELTVTVRPAQVRVLPVSGDGITIVNDANERLDLSGWRLTTDMGSFRIPTGMILLPKASVLLPFAVTNLPISFEAALQYPDGVIATRTTLAAATAAPVQPSLDAVSYEQVQAVEPAISTSVSGATHEKTAVNAPAPVSNKETGAGAVSTTAENGTAAVGNSSAAGIFKSPWTLSFLGMVMLAGSAFIFL